MTISDSSAAINSLIEPNIDYIDVNSMHEQLMSQGGSHSTKELDDEIRKVEDVINFMVAKKGKLTHEDYIPVSREMVIFRNGGSWPETRYTIYKNARICMQKDIPYIKAMESLTTTDVNHPADTGKLAAAQAL